MGKQAKYAAFAGMAQGFTQGMEFGLSEVARNAEELRRKRLAEYEDGLATQRDEANRQFQGEQIDKRIAADQELWAARDKARLQELQTTLAASAAAGAAERQNAVMTVIATRQDEILSDPQELAAAEAYAEQEASRMSKWYSPESKEYGQYGRSKAEALVNLKNEYLQNRIQQMAAGYAAIMGVQPPGAASPSTGTPSPAPAPGGGPMPLSQAAEILRSDPTPENQQFFEKHYGPEALAQVMGQMRGIGASEEPVINNVPNRQPSGRGFQPFMGEDSVRGAVDAVKTAAPVVSDAFQEATAGLLTRRFR